MKSFKREVFTIVLLLVVALVGTYVVNAAPTTQPSPDHESVSPEAKTVYQPLALEFGGVEMSEHDGIMLAEYSFDCNLKCNSSEACSNWNDMGFNNASDCRIACETYCAD